MTHTTSFTVSTIRERRFCGFAHSPEVLPSHQDHAREHADGAEQARIIRPGERYSDGEIAARSRRVEERGERLKQACDERKRQVPQGASAEEWAQQWDAWMDAYRSQHGTLIAGWQVGMMSTTMDRLEQLVGSYEAALAAADRVNAAAMEAIRPAPRAETPKEPEYSLSLTPEEYDRRIGELRDIAAAEFPRLFSPDVYRRFRTRGPQGEILWNDQVSKVEREAGGKNAKAFALLLKRLDAELRDDERVMDTTDIEEGLRKIPGITIAPKPERHQRYKQLREKVREEGLLS